MNKIFKHIFIGTGIIVFTACGGGSGTTSTTGDVSTSEETSSATSSTNSGMMHNGFSYGTVTSPFTGKVWLDRNIGAARVCENYDDEACYGDYYQWGRNTDGHEDSMSAVSDTLATKLDTDQIKFIASKPNYLFDWVGENVDNNGTKRAANWMKSDGSSVCPVGFRVPTLIELKAELLDEHSARINSSIGAFKSFLKLPSAGKRNAKTGKMELKGSMGYLWTSTPDLAISRGDSDYVYFSGEVGSSSKRLRRGHGLSVRCIQH